MISVEEVRQEILTAFKTIHDANSSYLVNYPNLKIVDIERQRDPFVEVELDFTGITHAAIGEKEILIPGFFNVYFNYRNGTGTSASTLYTDILNQHLSLEQFGDIQFGENKPMSVEFIPGWQGVMNNIRFDITQNPSC